MRLGCQSSNKNFAVYSLICTYSSRCQHPIDSASRIWRTARVAATNSLDALRSPNTRSFPVTKGRSESCSWSFLVMVVGREQMKTHSIAVSVFVEQSYQRLMTAVYRCQPCRDSGLRVERGHGGFWSFRTSLRLSIRPNLLCNYILYILTLLYDIKRSHPSSWPIYVIAHRCLSPRRACRDSSSFSSPAGCSPLKKRRRWAFFQGLARGAISSSSMPPRFRLTNRGCSTLCSSGIGDGGCWMVMDEVQIQIHFPSRGNEMSGRSAWCLLFGAAVWPPVTASRRFSGQEAVR